MRGVSISAARGASALIDYFYHTYNIKISMHHMTPRRISLIKEHARYVIFCKTVNGFLRLANNINRATVKGCDDKIVVIRNMFTYMDRYKYVWLGKTGRILASFNYTAS